MRQPPEFWRAGGGRIWPSLLAPAAALVGAVAARRACQLGWPAPVPVICCGNASVGGAGKTTLVLDLVARLSAQGFATHTLTRGYAGILKGPIKVETTHSAEQVGDEALLLAAAAPCWVGADRAETARAAIDAGAQILLMDDGLQNFSLRKNLSLLVVDGAAGFGNGRVLPAGPLREKLAGCAARCGAAILIGPDQHGARAQLPPSLPVLTADLVPGPEIAPLRGKKLFAFAGIGRPAKFFDMLTSAGLRLAGAIPFPDHHVFTAEDFDKILRQAAAAGATPVTTAKDLARMPPPRRGAFVAVTVSLAWHDAAALARLLAEACR